MSDSYEFNPTKQYEKTKDSERTLILTAIIMSSCVNFVVSGVSAKFVEYSPLTTIIIGIIGVVISFVIYHVSQFGKLKKDVCVKGFIIYDTKKRDIVYIPNYEISLRLSNFLYAILYGNKELADIWRDNLIAERIIDYEPFRIYDVYSESDKLFVELIEYCVLDIMSCTLIDYFSGVKKIKIETLGRDDMKDILSKNRVLEWISDPEGNECGVVASCKVDKTKKDMYIEKPIYSRFEMVIPKGGKIKRNVDNSIEIICNLFSIRISIDYSGLSGGVPSEFYTRYLGVNKDEMHSYRYRDYQYSTRIDVAFKPYSLIKHNAREYYEWVDVFYDRINKFMSSKDYFDSIGWTQVETVLHCLDNFKNE